MITQLSALKSDFHLRADSPFERGTLRDRLDGPYNLTDPSGNKLTDPSGNYLVVYIAETVSPINLSSLKSDFILNAR